MLEAPGSDSRAECLSDRRRLHHHSACPPRLRPHARNQRTETLKERATMSTNSGPALTRPESLGKKLRNAAVGILFALVLLIPRILHLRRNPRSWRLFCILLGIAGAALVILPLGLGNNYAYALIGMVLFITAILLPPAKPVFNADEKARELGALVVVNGGQYRSQNYAYGKRLGKQGRRISSGRNAGTEAETWLGAQNPRRTEA